MLKPKLAPAPEPAARKTTGHKIGWAVEQMEAGRAVRVADDPGIKFVKAQVPAAKVTLLLGIVDRAAEALEDDEDIDLDAEVSDMDVIRLHQLDVDRIFSDNWELAE
jgi:hypothetical protein